MGLRDWLRSKSKAERHRRKIERELWSPLPPVTEAEVAEVVRMTEHLTGELPIVVLDPQRPGIYRYDEPIGPQPPTVDERFAAFTADPLGAALPGAPAKDNTLYAGLLGEHAPVMSPGLLAELEGPTGSWRAEDFQQIVERGKR